MQAKSSLPYTLEAVNRLKKKFEMTRLCNQNRDSDKAFALDLPYEVGLKLTNRCDLRCTHCFQWNDEGYHKFLPNGAVKKTGDLEIEIVREIFKQTQEVKSLLYLWGGEPMIYSYWDELIELLEKDPRETVVCTNGLSIEKKLDSLLKVSEVLTMLVSIEGFEEDHDRLRGKNSFKKIMAGVNKLLELKEQNIYKGTVSIAAVFTDTPA